MPAKLDSFELDMNFKGGAVATFQRKLSPPDDELIIRADQLRDVAKGFQANRPNDAALILRAAQAYEAQLTAK